MSQVTCPSCNKLTKQGGFRGWQILVAICLFPIGLIALLAEKEPTKCQYCKHTWQT